MKLNGSEETETRGLETLADRCKDYTTNGAVFAKWRSVFKVIQSTCSFGLMTRKIVIYARYVVFNSTQVFTDVVFCNLML